MLKSDNQTESLPLHKGSSSVRKWFKKSEPLGSVHMIGRQTEKYRSDIDGLRAIAVMLVLLFHGGNEWFSSGFIGVDIFFVISGYLITSIIFNQLTKGTFSFREFYTRRMWRLQPALLVVYAVTLIAAIILYLPDDFIDYLKSAKYSSMLLSNQYFERTTTAYAAPDSAALLLLHTWSLAIEWQWYLVLPVGLVIAYRKLSLKTLPLVICIAAILAIALSMWLSYQEPDKSYYFFLSRIFELLIGSSAALFGMRQLKIKPLQANLVAIASLMVIAYCSTRTGILRGFPDYHAVLACLAAAMLLVPGVGIVGWHGKIIGSAIPRFVGKISYSLYLWHWPVLAVMAYVGLNANRYSSAVYYTLAFVLAIVSYYLIEAPFRRTKLKVYPTLIILILVPIAIFSLGYKFAVKAEGWPVRLGHEFAAIQSKIKAYDVYHRRDCIDGLADGSDVRCIVGQKDAPRTALMIGDSFSNQYTGFVDVLGKNAGVSVNAISTSACLALPDLYLYNWWKYKDDLYYKCHDNAVAYYDLIKRGHFNYVILSQVWENYAGNAAVHTISDDKTIELSRDRIEASLRGALQVILASGARPVVIKAVQTMPEGVNECLLKPYKMRQSFHSSEAAARCLQSVQTPEAAQWFEQLFQKLKTEFPTLIIIDPKAIQCSNGVCNNTIEGVPVYRDIGHITDFASHKLAEGFLSQFGNPLL